MHPSPDGNDPIKQNRHPPRPAPELEFLLVPRRSEISSGRITVVRRERPWVVQPERHGDARLEAREDPDFDPSAFGVEVPGEEDAGLHDGEDVVPAGHRPIDVLPRLPGVKLGETVSSRSIWEGHDV